MDAEREACPPRVTVLPMAPGVVAWAVQTALASREVHSAPAVFCEPLLQDVVRAGIGGEAPTLFSRAGHDAMAVGAVTGGGDAVPPQPRWISDHLDEAVSFADFAAGDGLAEAVLG